MIATDLSHIVIPRASNYISRFKSAMLDRDPDGHPPSLDLVESRIHQILADFLAAVTPIFKELSSYQPTTEDEETLHMNLISKLSRQLHKIQGQSKALDDALIELSQDVDALRKRELATIQKQDHPSLLVGPSATGRHWATVHLTKADDFYHHSIELPYEVGEALKMLVESRLSFRCKAQILFAFYQNRVRLYRALVALIKCIDTLSDSPTSKQIARAQAQIAKHLKVPFILGDLEKAQFLDMLEEPSELSALRTLLDTRKKTVLRSLSAIRKGVETVIPFKCRSTVLFFLKNQVLKNDPKAAKEMVHFLDRYGIIRAQALLKAGHSESETIRRLGILLEEHILPRLKVFPEFVLRKWYGHFSEEEALPCFSSLSVKNVAVVLLDLNAQAGIIEHEAQVICTEFLLMMIDPTGIHTAQALAPPKPTIGDLCRAYGMVHVIHFKHRCIIQEESTHFRANLNKAFYLRAGAMVESTEHKEAHDPVGFTDTILPLMQLGTLKKPLRRSLAASLVHLSAECLCRIPTASFYSGSWEHTEESRDYIHAATQLAQFACQKVLEGPTLEARGHTLGQFLLLAQELVLQGELFFAVYLFFNQGMNLKAEHDFVREHSTYAKAEAWLWSALDMSHNYSAIRTREAASLKNGLVHVPYRPLHEKDLKQVLEVSNNFLGGLVASNNYLVGIAALSFWVALPDNRYAMTTLVKEVQKHPVLEEKDLFALIEKFKARSVTSDQHG